MIKKRDLPYCPISTTLQIIGSKWKIIILQKLEEKPWRFNELKREIKGISKAVLSSSLHSMEQDGILARKANENAAYIEYQLTDLGLSLIPILKEMEKWGKFYKAYYNSKYNQE